MNTLDELRTAIDGDIGLASKRKLLVITSIILLAMQFTGAKIVEANTFILKVNFTDSKGLGLFFIMAIAFLMLRYYNYAKVYHDKLYGFWTEELLSDRFFFIHHYEADEYSGLRIDLEPERLQRDYRRMMYRNESMHLTVDYKSLFLFRRSLMFNWRHEHDDTCEEVYLFSHSSVTTTAYIKVLGLEAYYQVKSWLTRRETLDLYSPYLIGLFAISSLVFNDSFKAVTGALRALIA